MSNSTLKTYSALLILLSPVAAWSNCESVMQAYENCRESCGSYVTCITQRCGELAMDAMPCFSGATYGEDVSTPYARFNRSQQYESQSMIQPKSSTGDNCVSAKGRSIRHRNEQGKIYYSYNVDLHNQCSEKMSVMVCLADHCESEGAPMTLLQSEGSVRVNVGYGKRSGFRFEYSWSRAR